MFLKFMGHSRARADDFVVRVSRSAASTNSGGDAFHECARRQLLESRFVDLSSKRVRVQLQRSEVGDGDAT